MTEPMELFQAADILDTIAGACGDVERASGQPVSRIEMGDLAAGRFHQALKLAVDALRLAHFRRGIVPVEYLTQDPVEGATLHRMALSEWPEWAHGLRDMLHTGPRWTTEKPTVAGWYWYANNNPPNLVHLCVRRGTQYFGGKLSADFGRVGHNTQNTVLPVSVLHGMFQGPLRAPEGWE